MTIANGSREREQRKIRALARDYRKAGYQVVIEPKENEIPEFLAGFTPDLIAIGKDESVVAEVTSQPVLGWANELSALTARVNAQSGWRLELVVTGPRDLGDTHEDEIWDPSTIARHLGTVKRLSKMGERDAAFLLLWASTEATLRQLARSERVALQHLSPSQIVKQLTAQGVISPADFVSLERAVSRRNAVVHGRGDSGLEPELLDDLAVVTEGLLEEVQTRIHHTAKRRA